MCTKIRSTGLLAVFLLSTLGLQGCVGTLLNLPTPEEKKALLESHINSSSRIAVVTMRSGSYVLPRNGFGEYAVEAAANVTRDVLGTEVVAIDQSETGEWAQELARVKEEGGGVNGESHAEYFRARGFDAWVLFTASGDGGFPTGKAGNASWVYNPGTRIFTVDGTVNRKMLYWSSQRFTAPCEIQGRLIFNYKKKFEILFPEECAEKVIGGFRSELMETLGR